MQYDRGKKIRLGLFILLGTVVFVAFFYLIGSSSKIFSKSVTLHTIFPSVSGLRAGDHVRFSGIIVGTVSDLQITTDTTVVVDMSVDRKMLRFIRKDSRIEIKPEALIGDKMLVIYSGTSESDHVTEGDFLQPIGSVHLEDVVSQLTGELKKADVMIRNLVEISSKVNNGEGNVGRMLNDSTLVMKMDQSADNFVYLTQNLKILSEQLRNPDSDIGKLIYRDNLTTKMDSILSTMDRVAANTEMATRDLARTSEQLHSSALAVNTGSGAVHKLLYDSAFADTIGLMIDNLNQTLIEVEKVAVNLQHKKLFGGTKEKK
jgi:phospholipid/cholesterol/gamma-HCH transport system substrate-binding protein